LLLFKYASKQFHTSIGNYCKLSAVTINAESAALAPPSQDTSHNVIVVVPSPPPPPGISSIAAEYLLKKSLSSLSNSSGTGPERLLPERVTRWSERFELSRLPEMAEAMGSSNDEGGENPSMNAADVYRLVSIVLQTFIFALGTSSR
jgi:hypothetical protein